MFSHTEFGIVRTFTNIWNGLLRKCREIKVPQNIQLTYIRGKGRSHKNKVLTHISSAMNTACLQGLL